mmetsp:Transcript_54311/g.153873  ORF Transcript_54311/g.153873 Transcript_54311/m.153873 type:complete len:101 (+) Transcript_54311:115-417(+)
MSLYNSAKTKTQDAGRAVRLKIQETLRPAIARKNQRPHGELRSNDPANEFPVDGNGHDDHNPNCSMASLPEATSATKMANMLIMAMRPLLISLRRMSALY